MSNTENIPSNPPAQTQSGSGVDLQRLVRCDCCGAMFNPDDLNTVDVDKYGEHSTIEVCDNCKTEPIPVDLTDIDETHWTETHGTPDGGGC